MAYFGLSIKLRPCYPLSMGKQFDAIVCDLSAWQYWSTPPAIRKAVLPSELAHASLSESAEFPACVLVPRKNAGCLDTMIRSRLLTELKAVTLPVHILASDPLARRKTRLVHPHRMRVDLAESELFDLGGGLAVSSPEATLRHLARKRSFGFVLQKMYEACGIYALVPQTSRVEATVNLLANEGALSRDAIKAMPSISAFYDASGAVVPHVNNEGKTLNWKPAIDRSGNITGLWKRPPLVSLDALLLHTETAARIPRARGTARALRAARQTMEGSASPLESKAAIMLFAARSIGSEHLTEVKLNHTVGLTAEAALLASQNSCIADALDSQHGLIFEVNGRAFHADRDGFVEHSGRRAALENMGYTVMDVTNEMLSDLERFDAFLTSVEKKAGIRLREKSVSFLERRDLLHAELFPNRA